MSTALLLVCAAALGQPAPEPPSVIPGFKPDQPYNFLYMQPPPEQAGKKNPTPNTPPAEEKKAAEGAEAAPSQPVWYSIHAQSTLVYQGNFPFHDPYDGPNSALGRVMNHQTATGTLYFDVRPWQGGEFIFDPEFSGGDGSQRHTRIRRLPQRRGHARRQDGADGLRRPRSSIGIRSSLTERAKRSKTPPTRSPASAPATGLASASARWRPRT